MKMHKDLSKNKTRKKLLLPIESASAIVAIL